MLLAHFDRESGKEQSLRDHLQDVSDEMKKGLETVSFSKQVIALDDLAEAGFFHDTGKASTWFQEYVKTGTCENSKKKTHALLSAALYSEYFQISDQEFPLLPVAAIACHHGSLSIEQPDDSSFDYLEEQYQNAADQLRASELKEKFTDIQAQSFSSQKFRKQWRRAKKKISSEKNQNPENFIGLQYLFSKLISADKRDSAGILVHKNGTANGDVDHYLQRKTGGKTASVNDIRTEIRNQVLDTIRNMTDQEVKDKRVFTLTAPTGSGKSLTSLSAALILKDRMEKVYGIEPHLITIVPFLNILEQMKMDYEQIFGDILVSSSAVSALDDPKRAGDDLSLSAQQLLSDSWMSPVVLSTSVQFFESILTGKNERLMKFQRLANAIVIMDEIQALEPERYPLYAVLIDLLAKHLGTRFILMTATQPKMFDCAKEYGYHVQERTELLHGYEKYFRQLDRTCLIPVMDQIDSIIKLCDVIENQFDSLGNTLVVVNRIADSIETYKELKNRGLDVLYLSTNITGYDRKLRIQEASRRLKDDASAPFIMVATQTIEAGVDLDFDSAFRDLAPLPSIIQVAGRVNRSGNKQENSPVYIFNTGNGKKVYSHLALNITSQTLGAEILPEKEYQTLTENYYDRLIKDRAISYERRIYEEGILPLEYDIINEFQMIGQQDRYSVIFLQNTDAKECVRSICEEICKPGKDYNAKVRIRKLFNQLSQYTVDIFANRLKKNLPMPFADYSKDICGRTIQLPYFIVTEDDLDRYYDETGFIAEEADMYMF